jgi:hypothetical protein
LSVKRGRLGAKGFGSRCFGVWAGKHRGIIAKTANTSVDFI